MNQMEIFQNPEFGSVRIAVDGEKYFFCGMDVARALGYKDTVNALKAHCKEDGVAFYHLTDSLGREQKAKFISEGNLYRLIVHSNHRSPDPRYRPRCRSRRVGCHQPAGGLRHDNPGANAHVP